jgi:hypothetical protein
VTKRKPATTRAVSPRTTRPPQGATETVAVYVGRTLGELLNRKEELQKQLSQLEAQIADATGDVRASVAKYLPKSFPGLRRTTRRPAATRKAGRATRPPHVHGRDHETAVAKVVEKAAASSDRTKKAARPRSAPRATRRG